MLLASGTDIALVLRILGHSSITLTADTYSHLLAGVGEKAADADDALIPRASCDQSLTRSPVGDLSESNESGLEPLLTWDDAGRPRGTRTHNPRIKSPMLCQLS